MSLLIVGLLAAGIGTLLFLRTTLLANLDAQVSALAPTDVAGGLIEIEDTGAGTTFVEKPDAPNTQYFVAIYDAEGVLQAYAGGDGDVSPPDFPSSFTLQQTATQGLTPFEIPSTDGESVFRAAVDTYPVDGTSALFTQMVALPVAQTNSVVASYISIYGILALLILVASAVATRWLVTLTFRSLGEVESTADTIAAGDFGQRMTHLEPPTTEVGRLKNAINAMLDRVDAAISQRDATVRQMRRFIGDASHELRTPLVTVRGYAELYRMGAISGDDDVRQAMERIEKEAMRMGVLVEDLLALARLDERRDVIVTAVDLGPIARDAALDLRAAAPQRPVTVYDTTTLDAPRERGTEDTGTVGTTAKRRPAPASLRIAGASLSRLRRKPRGGSLGTETTPIEVDPSADTQPVALTPPPMSTPMVLGDENRIRQVVANLLGNARRYSVEDSPIELRVGSDPTTSMGWIEVIDHGEGVPDQIKARIFERFWRADTSRARETGGSGLGLSIVASVVEALHGDVKVFDTPGGGATFRVAFPLAERVDAATHATIETQPIERPRAQD